MQRTSASGHSGNKDETLQRAHKREAALREILELISRSRDDQAPVFDAIVRHAAQLCKASIANLVLVNTAGTLLVQAASHGEFLRAQQSGDTWPMDPPGPVARSIREARSVHVHDLAETEEYRTGDKTYVQLVDEDGLRTDLSVPLLRDGAGFGAILLSRREVDPFDDADIALVETFAAQAVIAIENVRQFRELDARLAREAATREVLEVISRSRDDDQPVFDVLLRKAAELCGAFSAALVLGRKGETVQRMVAQYGVEPGTVAIYDRGEVSMDPGKTNVAQAIDTGQIVNVVDLMDTGPYRQKNAAALSGVHDSGIRSIMYVPLLTPAGAIGCFNIFRKEVRPFTSEDIRLVETFAAQAVIAIENVRLFRELQTRLAREKASAEILEVISNSRDDDRPVFDVILHQAADLCDAAAAALVIGKAGDNHQRLAGQYGMAPESVALYHSGDVSMDPDISLAARAILTGEAVHIADMIDTDGYRNHVGHYVSAVRDTGVRTNLFVPLLSEQVGIGCLIIFRKEVRPYTPDEISIVENFAAQAVIAIKNVRQFRELRTRLEREAATREILEVISQSRDDDRPVFDTILSNAIRLCGADTAALFLGRPEDARMTLAAWRDRDAPGTADDAAMIESMNATDLRMDPELHATARAIVTGEVVHILDVLQTEGYLSAEPSFRIMVETLGVRTYVSVPLFGPQGALGVISLHRREVLGFDVEAIELICSFASQAVIAIENVRQFRELEMRLEREAATRDILEVISQSRDDDTPVFETIVRNAQVLCDAPQAALILARNGDAVLRLAAHRNLSDRTVEMFRSGQVQLDGMLSYAARSILEASVINLADMKESDLYHAGSPVVKAMVDDVGIRSVLFLPLLSGDHAIGTFALFRYEVVPFEDRHVELVRSFAAQAVIAIENVRQFKALEVLNAELGGRVETQVGEIERIGRLKRFLPSAIANAVVSSGSEKMLSSHRALLGVLFCDIRGFTAFCETAEPEETIEVLQTYHIEMGRLINAHGAGVDHRMGDGIMVLFNDPLPCDDPAGDAVGLALAMRARMAELSLQWKRLGHRLGFGIGVSLGYATVGMVGSEGRFDYTASGTAINLASRLCDEALDGEILLSPRARIAVEDRFSFESRGEINLKGIRELVEVFKLTGRH